MYSDPTAMAYSEEAPWGTVDTRFEPIHTAARMRDLEAVQRDLAADVDVNVINGRTENGDGGNTALWFAAQGPRPNGADVARLLIEAGTDINKQCEHGRTALHMAAAWGHAEVAQLLLEHGADPTIVDDEGMTPWDVARHGYRSNNVTAEQRNAVCRLFEALGLETL
jgi:ankyrin repeat protein